MRRYRWNEGAQQYVDERGRFVARDRVRLAVDQAIRGEQREIKAASVALRAGTITPDEWYLRMRAAIKDVELFSAAAARGGWAQMTPRDYGKVGAAVKKQYAYLDRFAGEIEAGYNLDGRFLMRAQSYANAGRPLYHDMVGESMESAGYTLERNKLHATESCTGCLTETARGWVPIGELVPIGGRTCLGFCKCTIEYKQED